jgi:hypothetical protein
MAAFLHRLWLLLDGDPTAAPDPGFTDVPSSHPFFADIAWMADEGIASGFTDGGFHPNAPVSRQAMAAFMFRFWQGLGGVPGSYPDPGFDDVPETSPFLEAISWMAAQDITGGFPDGGFHPRVTVSRQAMAAFLFRLFDLETVHVCTDQTQIPITECTGLLALFNATGGEAWTTQTGWLTSTPPCDWYGVDCLLPGHVSLVTLSSNNLTGSLPTQIDALPLIALQAPGNELIGAIPEDLGNLTDLLTLIVNDNQLSGPLPEGMLAMDGLEVLELHGNGCFTASAELAAKVAFFDPNWDDGCEVPTDEQIRGVQ